MMNRSGGNRQNATSKATKQLQQRAIDGEGRMNTKVYLPSSITAGFQACRRAISDCYRSTVCRVPIVPHHLRTTGTVIGVTIWAIRVPVLHLSSRYPILCLIHRIHSTVFDCHRKVHSLHAFVAFSVSLVRTPCHRSGVLVDKTDKCCAWSTMLEHTSRERHDHRLGVS